KRAGHFLGNIKLTTMIAALVISAIIVSVSVVTAAIYLNLSASTRSTALSQQMTNLKTAATIVEGNLPGAEVVWGEAGELAEIHTWAMPRQFLNHDMVDSIARITGEAASIFGWDAAGRDFVRMTTTIADRDGQRLVGTSLGQANVAYATLLDGKAYYGED